MTYRPAIDASVSSTAAVVMNLLFAASQFSQAGKVEVVTTKSPASSKSGSTNMVSRTFSVPTPSLSLTVQVSIVPVAEVAATGVSSLTMNTTA